MNIKPVLSHDPPSLRSPPGVCRVNRLKQLGICERKWRSDAERNRRANLKIRHLNKLTTETG